MITICHNDQYVESPWTMTGVGNRCRSKHAGHHACTHAYTHRQSRFCRRRHGRSLWSLVMVVVRYGRSSWSSLAIVVRYGRWLRSLIMVVVSCGRSSWSSLVMVVRHGRVVGYGVVVSGIVIGIQLLDRRYDVHFGYRHTAPGSTLRCTF